MGSNVRFGAQPWCAVPTDCLVLDLSTLHSIWSLQYTIPYFFHLIAITIVSGGSRSYLVQYAKSVPPAFPFVVFEQDQGQAKYGFGVDASNSSRGVNLSSTSYIVRGADSLAVAMQSGRLLLLSPSGVSVGLAVLTRFC